MAATALVLDQIWTRVFIGQGDTDEAARVSHLLRLDPNEIPIFGSSKARAAYVPSLIDPRAFNYGMDAASLDVVNVFLGIELAKNKQGPVIVDLAHNASNTVGNLLKFVPFADRPACPGCPAAQRRPALAVQYPRLTVFRVLRHLSERLCE